MTNLSALLMYLAGSKQKIWCPERVDGVKPSPKSGTSRPSTKRSDSFVQRTPYWLCLCGESNTVWVYMYLCPESWEQTLHVQCMHCEVHEWCVESRKSTKSLINTTTLAYISFDLVSAVILEINHCFLVGQQLHVSTYRCVLSCL